VSEVATGKVRSVCVTRSECSKQAASNMQCACGEVVLMCECVLCVGSYIPTTNTAVTTHVYSACKWNQPGAQYSWYISSILFI